MSAGRDDKARSQLRAKQRLRRKLERLEIKAAQRVRRLAYRLKNRILRGHA